MSGERGGLVVALVGAFFGSSVTDHLHLIVTPLNAYLWSCEDHN